VAAPLLGMIPDDPHLQFTRVYRNEDDRSRSFGIGGTDSFEIMLGGQMGAMGLGAMGAQGALGAMGAMGALGAAGQYVERESCSRGPGQVAMG